MQVYYTILYRQKKLQEENVARKISQLSQLFLLQQYNFSQFALFSSCNLYSKGSSRHPLLINFLIFFVPSPRSLFQPSLFIIFSNLFKRGQTDPILAGLFKFHPIHFSSLFIKYLEKFHLTCLFRPPCLLSIWVNAKSLVYSLVYSFLLICIQHKIGNHYKLFYHF